MKTCINRLFIVAIVLAGIAKASIFDATAQTFTTLHNFTGTGGGSIPLGGIILSGDTLYGATSQGGNFGYGAVFKIQTNGTSFTLLYSFPSTSGTAPHTNSYGAYPQARLLLSSNTLYGTTGAGGKFGRGVIFAISTNGSGFTNMHHFTGGSDGCTPVSGLILSSNSLYGTTLGESCSGNGTVYAINTDGTGFRTVHSFGGGNGGNRLTAEVLLSGDTLFGTTQSGGSYEKGTIFSVNINGTGFTNLHSFSGSTGGSTPMAGLLMAGNTLYGATIYGGNSGNGMLFSIITNGTSFTNLYSFTSTSGSSSTNIDGISPQDEMIISGNTLYGTAHNGGRFGNGTVFAINVDGTGFTNLHSFTATSGNYTNSDGIFPRSSLILAGNSLFGTASQGGRSNRGTLFKLSLPPPQLASIRSVGNLVLKWASYAPGVVLQTTTDLVPSATWTTNLYSPMLINGQYVVTNPISGSQKFYRLTQQ